MSLPSIVRGDGASLVRGRKDCVGTDNLFCFFISISISRTRDVHGFIALLMDLPSIAALKTIVNDFIERHRKATIRSCWITSSDLVFWSGVLTLSTSASSWLLDADGCVVGLE